jgi:hypothetical protein
VSNPKELNRDLLAVAERLGAYGDWSGQDVTLVIGHIRAAVLELSEAVPAARLYTARAARDGDGWRVTVTDTAGAALHETRTEGVIFNTGPVLVYELARVGLRVTGWKLSGCEWHADVTRHAPLKPGETLSRAVV